MAPSAAGQIKDVLLGPKTPFWSCSAWHRAGNWARRTVCKCGAKAPPKVLQAAKKAHEEAK
eukprot:3003113-Pyramimonas_sp.AAC.1